MYTPPSTYPSRVCRSQVEDPVVEGERVDVELQHEGAETEAEDGSERAGGIQES